MKLKLIIFLTCLSQACFLTSYAQKKAVDNDTYKNWESLGSYKISNDGRYVWYSRNLPSGITMVLKSTGGTYKKEFPGVFDASFTEDSRFLIFNSPKGLAILKIGAQEPEYIAGASEFSMPKEGDGRWLAYKIKGDLRLKDIFKGTEKTFAGVSQSWFNDQGTALLLQTKTAVIWVNLPGCSQKNICTKAHAVNVAFDRTGTQLAFTAQKGEPVNPIMAFAAKNGKTKKKTEEVSLRYFQKDMDSAIVKVTNHSPGIERGFIINADAPAFSPDGKRLIFKLDQGEPVIPQDTSVITDKVDIWSYREPRLQSEQLFSKNVFHITKSYTAVIPATENANRVFQLENASTRLAGKPGNQYALAYDDLNANESFWQKTQIPTWSLVYLSDGSRRTIPQQPKAFDNLNLCLSPSEHFVCWFDTLSKQYQAYEIATNTTRKISAAIPTVLCTRETNDESIKPFGIAGWLANDEAILIYDKHDIWQLDPKGTKAPINLTGGYGDSHHVAFRIAIESGSLQSIKPGDPILVAALDDKMYNGFCKIKTGISTPPRLGRMQPCMFYFQYGIVGEPPLPIKAKNVEVYIMQQQSAIEAPNVVVTRNFNTYTQLSDIHPQQAYNWMTSELLHWKMNDGHTGTGILYKPENFDRNKKYPSIVHYYQERSGEMYEFRRPELSGGNLEIAWYVSNGYLVFIPDIIRPTGHPTEAILNVVESGTKYLTSFPYVDASKVGLQGHSFGGYETNVIVTHCNLFSAAQSSSGISDLISYYGGFGFLGQSLNFMLESGQVNLGTGKTPWLYPELYRQNSPIFFVDKITAPLLIMHNKNDVAVPYTQSVELFTALRRLQKPVWMLQYDDESHIIGGPENRLDFTIRQQQFFDHYLKGKPAPKWMTDGIPAKYKGLVSGLQLDTADKQP